MVEVRAPSGPTFVHLQEVKPVQNAEMPDGQVAGLVRSFVPARTIEQMRAPDYKPMDWYQTLARDRIMHLSQVNQQLVMSAQLAASYLRTLKLDAAGQDVLKYLDAALAIPRTVGTIEQHPARPMPSEEYVARSLKLYGVADKP